MRGKAVGLIIATFLAVVGCKSNEDYAPDQRTQFESYLDRLGVEYSQPGGVYRVIANSDRAEYESATELQPGDSAYLYFATYIFSSYNQELVYSNMSSVADSVDGLNTEYWSFDPYRIRLGATPMIGGLANGLPGCRQGDSVMLFIISDLAYADKQVGVISPNTPLMMIVNVEKVIK